MGDAGIRIRPVGSAECPLCWDAIGADEDQTCPGCSTAYHAECLAELGGCAILGCSQGAARSVRREAPRFDPRRWECATCHAETAPGDLQRRVCRCGASLHEGECTLAHAEACKHAPPVVATSRPVRRRLLSGWRNDPARRRADLPAIALVAGVLLFVCGTCLWWADVVWGLSVAYPALDVVRKVLFWTGLAPVVALMLLSWAGQLLDD